MILFDRPYRAITMAISIRGDIPMPRDNESPLLMPRSLAGMPQPAIFVAKATPVRTRAKSHAPEDTSPTSMSTPRERKNIGANTHSSTFVLPWNLVLYSHLANIVPATHAPTIAERPMASEIVAYNSAIERAMRNPLSSRPLAEPLRWTEATTLVS